MRLLRMFPVAALLSVFWVTALEASPAIEHWTGGSGARVYYLHAPELPMVDVQLIFDAGSVRDADLPGLANMTRIMLAQGTVVRDADAVAEGFDSLGARFGGGVGRDSAQVSLRSLSAPEYLQPAIALLAEILSAPRFGEAELERERSRLLAALDQSEQRPGPVAGRRFYEAVYGDHPYAHDPEGRRASLQAIQREDLAAFHQRFYVGSNVVVAVVGDLGRDRVRVLVDELLADLPAGEPAPAPPAVTPGGGELLEVAFPSSQTHILVGGLGMQRGDPDYFALYLGNHILGGSGLVSRLSEEVRQKRGLAYSTGSYFVPLRREGVFVMSTQTRNDQAGAARQLMEQTLRRFVIEGPTEEEVRDAKQNLIGGFPLRIDSNRKLAGYLGVIGFYDLPLSYLDDFPAAIEQVSREDIVAAFRRRLDPDALVAVEVGGDG